MLYIKISLMMEHSDNEKGGASGMKLLIFAIGLFIGEMIIWTIYRRGRK